MSAFTNEVVGPLTDAELRATPVPTSPTGTQDVNVTNGSLPVTGPLTDTQLRATAVPVSGPLTDAQLRATPVPVSGTVSVNEPVTVDGAVSITGTVSTIPGATNVATVTNVSVGPSVVTLSTANAKTGIGIYNETGTLFVKFAAGASSVSYTKRMTASEWFWYTGHSGIVTAIKASGTTPVHVTEFGI